MRSINPATEEIFANFKTHSDNEAKSIVDNAYSAFKLWQQKTTEERGKYFVKLADILEKDKKDLATLISNEMGKPFKEAVAEIEKCAWVCRFYAENAVKFLQNEIVKTDAKKAFLAFQPIGVILTIMPWNFPFWQVLRCAVPAVIAGNSCVLKHASNVPSCASKIEELFIKAGFPKDVFRTLLISSSQVDPVIEHQNIAGVSLTGSVKAGSQVAKKAGEHIKKTVLELGGNDPYVVLADADLDLAVTTCVNSRLLNSGQTCVSAKRFIVVEEIYEQFKAKCLELMKTKKFGNPLDDNIDIGPLATKEIRNKLHRQVEESIAKGAKCELGGKMPTDNGFFYPPTLLTGVKPGMPAYEEELFGPVATLIRAKGEEDAINIANDSIFGLGGAVFTKDIKKGEEIAKYKIMTGCCFVNQMVRSDPRLAFGGVKQSGYGRELSYFGIREFVNIKPVSIV